MGYFAITSITYIKEQEQTSIAQDFGDLRNFENCIRAIDGKHVIIQCFKNQALLFIIIKEHNISRL